MPNRTWTIMLVAASSSAACASSQGTVARDPPPVPQASRTTPEEAPAPDGPRPQGPRPDEAQGIALLAKRFRTAEQCEGDARQKWQAGKSTDGFLELNFCTERTDFFNVRPLLREPWMSGLKRQGVPGLVTFSRVVARNPDDFQVDLELLNEAGIKLRTLAKAEDRPRELVDRFVLLKGFLGPSAPDNPTLVAREVSRRPKKDAYLQRSGSFVFMRQGDKWQGLTWAPNGREIAVDQLGPGCKPSATELQVFLVRVRDLGMPKDFASPDAGAAPMVVGRGQLIACFPVSEAIEQPYGR